MTSEGMISHEEAIARIDPTQLDQLLHPMLDPKAEFEVAARGLNASPGSGRPSRWPRWRSACPRRSSS
jgi:pyruvate,orthophosphate dikinase